MADGPQTALAIVDEPDRGGAVGGYHLLPAVRGDLLARLGRVSDARDQCARAASLTRNERERALLLRRAASGARRSDAAPRGGVLSPSPAHPRRRGAA